MVKTDKVSELLLEIYSEEIPAKMQKKAVIDFQKIFIEFFTKENVLFKESDVRTFVTPRRLTLWVSNLNIIHKIESVRKNGPKITAPKKAVEGFAKSLGLNDISQLLVSEDKDPFYYYVKDESEINLVKILEDNIPHILQKMSNLWPKSMRWSKDVKTRWIRPIRNIMCVFDKKIVKFNFAGINSNNLTFGHLLFGKKEFIVNNFCDYEQILAKNFVILDHKKRQQIISSQIEKICKEKSLSLVSGFEPLLDEVVGLCEYPVVLLGNIEDKFLSLPEEILLLSIKTHQKYFCLKNDMGKLSPHFIFVANIKITKNNRQKIILDNEKILRARLKDAEFFIEQDLKTSLSARLKSLKNVVFHKELGSIFDKIERLKLLSKFISIWVPHADISSSDLLVELSKCDLVSKSVAEFPELQGIIGMHYARMEGRSESISKAISEQYLPNGLESDLPETPLGILLSMSDKIDNICGLFVAGEKPTSSKDPFGVRRCVIGIIRIISEYKISIPLKIIIETSLGHYYSDIKRLNPDLKSKDIKSFSKKLAFEICAFFIERTKSVLKNKIRSDILNEIFSINLEREKKLDLLPLILKAEFVNEFVLKPENHKILTLYRRVQNIVSLEEKKDKKIYDGKPSLIHLKSKYDKLLYRKTKSVESKIKKLLKHDQYLESLKVMLTLEHPMSLFFKNVMVNCDHDHLRINRLLILAKIKNLVNKIFDFSKIEIGD